MATTKAFELAQLSALTTVDASGNVTTNTSQIANASGDLTLDSVADIILNVDGGDLRLFDDTVQFGRISNDSTDLVIETYTADRSLVFKGVDGSTPISALILDMSNGGRATFNENVIIAGTLTGVTDFNSSGDMSVGGDLTVTGDLTVEGSQVTLNTTALDVEDKNITLNYHASNDTSASADGAGITIQDAVDASNDASILWDATNDKFTMSHGLTLLGATHLQFTRGGELRSTDTGGTVRTLARVNNSNELEYGWSGTGAVKFMGGGSYAEKIRIHTDGNVGIHEDNPEAVLHVYSNTTTQPAMIIRNDNASSGGRGLLIQHDNGGEATDRYALNIITGYGVSNQQSLFVGGSGVVGIGTDSPNAILDVRVDQDTLANVLANEIYAASFLSTDSGNTGHTTAIMLSGSSGTNRGVAIAAEAQSTGNDHDMIFATSASGATPSEHVRITSDGKVGIGTNDPSYSLHISGSGSQRLRIQKTDSGGDADLQLYSPSDSTQWILFGDSTSGNNSGVIKYVHSTNKMHFRTNDVDDRLVIADDGNVGIGTDSPDAGLHINGTSPHMDVGPHGGNRAKFGYHNLDVIIGSTSSTGEIIFKNNIGSTDSPQAGGNDKVTIHDVGMTIHSDTYNILDVQTDSNNDQTSTDGIIKITNYNGTSHLTKAEFRWDESEDLVHVSYGDHGRHISINSSGNVGIGTGSVSPVHTLDVDGAIATRQVRHDLQPSLSFDFANSKTLDSRIQYQRRGTATYFDDSGVMRYATHNVPRIDHDPSTGECKGLLVEEERTNYMTYPNEFAFAQWALPGIVAIQNVGLAPDGTYSADLLMLDYSYTARHFGYKVTPGAFLSGVTYNISCYFKAYGGFSESCKLGYRVDADGQGGDQYGSGFQIDAGEPAGNGWYRHSLTVSVSTNASLNFAEFVLGDQNGYQPTAGTGVYMWGFTVEKASNNTGATFPTSFIPAKQKLTGRASTTATYTRSDGVITTANEHQPRYDHALKDGIWRQKGLLLEAAATNLSQNFYYPASTLRWNSGVQNATITPVGSELAPDGSYNNVVRFKETTNNAATTASVYKPIAGTANTQRTFSVYAKKKELKMMRLYFDGTTPLCGQVIYNLDLGTIHLAQNPSGTDAWGIEDAGNGWWRCWFSGTVTGGQSTYYVHIDSADDFGNTSHQNTVNNGFYLWGPQMEYGGAPTSYIYTDDGTVTRTADIAESEAVTREGDNIKMYDMSFHNTIESTIYGEGTSISGNNDTGSNPCLWGLTDGTSSNRYLIRRYDNDTTNDPNYSGFTFRLQQTMPDGTTYNNDFFSPTANGLGEWDDAIIHKMALSISPGNQIGAADGKDAGMTSVTDMPPYTQATMVQIGHAGSSDYWNGHIRKLSYYPTQLNITELKALTESD